MANDQQTLDFNAENDAPEGETKDQRFKRVAGHRLKVAIERIRLLRQMFEGQAANGYEYTEDQIATLHGALYLELSDMENAARKRFRTERPVPTL